MAVGDEDGDASRARESELETDVRGGAARVDDDRIRGPVPGANEVAVRLDRAEGQLVDDREHGRESTDGSRFRCATRTRDTVAP